jgi:hypothetical protein
MTSLISIKYGDYLANSVFTLAMGWGKLFSGFTNTSALSGHE